jgi:hypothetical protein
LPDPLRHLGSQWRLAILMTLNDDSHHAAGRSRNPAPGISGLRRPTCESQNVFKTVIMLTHAATAGYLVSGLSAFVMAGELTATSRPGARRMSGTNPF